MRTINGTGRAALALMRDHERPDAEPEYVPDAARAAQGAAAERTGLSGVAHSDHHSLNRDHLPWAGSMISGGPPS